MTRERSRCASVAPSQLPTASRLLAARASLIFEAMTDTTYDLDELAKILKFTPAYVKMVLKKFDEYEAGKPISENLAAQVAQKLSRPWPPSAH